MFPRPLTRTVLLLLPVLGFLLTTLFTALPNSGATASTNTPGYSYSVPDREHQDQTACADHEDPDQWVHHARRFNSRPRALPLVSAVRSSVLIDIRNAQHTGLYVLRHADAYREKPQLSQYAYLFLLTPF